eukprot:13724174-Heterocapsa_arctica.AAC.1
MQQHVRRRRGRGIRASCRVLLSTRQWPRTAVRLAVGGVLAVIGVVEKIVGMVLIGRSSVREPEAPGAHHGGHGHRATSVASALPAGFPGAGPGGK